MDEYRLKSFKLFGIMTIGIDTRHFQSNSVSAFVASTNGTYTTWYGQTFDHSNMALNIVFRNALQEYKALNDAYPKNIIIFRSGVAHQFETVQMKKIFENVEYKPLFTVLQEFQFGHRGLYDFFLVPQNVRHSTVNSTHFNVIEDDNNFATSALQQLALDICPNTVCVPACSHFAIKFANFVVKLG